MLVDTTSAIRASYAYDAWGARTRLMGDLDTRASYAGYRLHAGSGLSLTWFRAYDVRLGRWLSRDPIGDAGGLNLYEYVGNGPVNWMDSLGLFPGDFNDVENQQLEIAADWARRTYEDLKQQRVANHAKYPGEANSSMRHCVQSCEAARKHGTSVARIAGVGNEVQGLIGHDIPNLFTRRPWGDRPWAFQLQDLKDNERGFDAAKRSGSCEEECRKKCK
jgi:RHS repeat-associated protein